MNSAWLYSIPLLGLALIAGAVYLLLSNMQVGQGPPAQEPAALVLWCDEDLRGPIAGTALEHGGGLLDQFERRSGIRVQVLYGQPWALLDRLERGESADLFLSGEPLAFRRAQQAGLIDASYALSGLAPVIMLGRGNPHDVTGVSDVLDRSVRLAVVNERTSHLGEMTRRVFADHGHALEESDIALTANSPAELPRMVQARRADAAIVWRHLARQYPGHPLLEVPMDGPAEPAVFAGLLSGSARSDTARQFAEFLAGPAGQSALTRYGFEPSSAARQ